MAITRVTDGVITDGAVTVNKLDNQAQSPTFRNRIINGDMRIDQRNAGAAVANANNYIMDRWAFLNGTDAVFSGQQVTDAPAGFINSALLTVTTADTSVTTTQNAVITQSVEGLNCSDLGWGSANAQTVTLSFWVKSSLTGTFGGSLRNSAFNRSYPFTYAISAANTWEQKFVTIVGDTGGTWLTTNGVGIRVSFSMGAGPDRSGTAGAWSSNNNVSATGATSVVGTNGATFYITGVQLEAGSVATPFERRQFGQELALCQRYYQKITTTGAGQIFGSGMMQGTIAMRSFIPFIVPTRVNPTAAETSGTAADYAVFQGADVINCSSVPTIVESTQYGIGLDAQIASGGTVGFGALLRSVNSNAFLAWSAEL
jgi:hypothetical protein